MPLWPVRFWPDHFLRFSLGEPHSLMREDVAAQGGMAPDSFALLGYHLEGSARAYAGLFIMGQGHLFGPFLENML